MTPAHATRRLSWSLILAPALLLAAFAIACDDDANAAPQAPGAPGVQPAPLEDRVLTADEALEEIDRLVHEYEDGRLSGEEAMEQIEDVIHDLPHDELTETLRTIDEIVHEWEDGDLTAEEALEQIDALLH